MENVCIFFFIQPNFWIFLIATDGKMFSFGDDVNFVPLYILFRCMSWIWSFQLVFCTKDDVMLIKFYLSYFFFTKGDGLSIVVWCGCGCGCGCGWDRWGEGGRGSSLLESLTLPLTTNFQSSSVWSVCSTSIILSICFQIEKVKIIMYVSLYVLGNGSASCVEWLQLGNEERWAW